MANNKKPFITIIGAGVAGLSTGYYANKEEFPFKIYEQSDHTGGISQTLKVGDFYFDTGAHRFYDKDTFATSLVKELVGKDLLIVDRPTQIFYKGRFVDFPLSPLNLLETLGLLDSSKAFFEILLEKRKKFEGSNFKATMTKKYGNMIASKFLLNYSQKLWGLECDQLSPSVSGKRLSGLDFRSLLLELILGKKAKTTHLDGTFYYPKYGIGTISDKLLENCGKNNVNTLSKVTKVFHKNGKISGVQINNSYSVDTDLLVNTISINSFLKILSPLPPKAVLDLAKNLKFRNVKIVVFFLNKPSITNSATIHIPDLNLPFTRIYEPKNRSKFMSPNGKTSIVVEFPYNGDKTLNNKKIIDIAKQALVDIKMFDEKDILDSYVYNINNAYPILEIGSEDKVEKIINYLNSFENLYSTGRNGLFKYSWIHDQIRLGKTIIENISKQQH